METLWQDIRVTLRSFRRSPGFPLTAIVTLALGIGATTAIFTTLSAVLLKPLPYPNPQELYSIRTTLTDGRVTTGLLSGGEIFRLNDPKLSIERAAGFVGFDLTLLAEDETPSHVKVYGVTEGYFELFGLPMTSGGFKPEDFVPFQPPPPQPNAPPQAQQQGPLPAIVISPRLWRNFFHGDPAIIGKAIRFAEFSSTVSGVAPADFDMPHGADIWIAQRTPANDVNHGQEGFLRLRHGQSIERANGEMATVIAGLAQEFPGSDKNRAYVTRPLVNSIVGDLGPILIIVMSATGLLLLLACVNVANLLLARGAARAREMAVRAALGAGWGRLVRQLVTESLLLATAGTVVGVAVGALGLKALLAIGASKLPRLDAVHFDGRVGLFALGVLVITGAIIGLAPAVRLLRSDMKTLMNDASRSTTAGRGTVRWLTALTVAEVALAIMLVAGAGWLVRGFASLRSTDAGFVADRRVLFDVSFLGPRYPSQDAVRQAHLDLVTALKNIRGVADAGLVSAYPLRGTLENSLLLQFHGEPFDQANPPGSRQRFVSPGLFAAMGTHLTKGRDFGPGDLPTTTPVAIVNQAFVDRNLKGRDPLDVQFSGGYPAPDPANEVTVIGVVDNVRQKTLADPAEPAFYVPLSQAPFRRSTAVVALAPQADIGAVERQIRAEVKKLNPTMALDFLLASDVVGDTLSRQQLGMTLMLIFGAIAIVLSAVGIYGVVSYAGALRRNEMATRLALGASAREVFMLVMRQGAMLGLLGAGIGLGLAYVSGRVVSSKVYAIRASDPLILGLAAVLITLITVVATIVPATRASRLNPADALQSE
ncbi:MAG TPA: ABC transporter permease [Gemmatimonadales bacterium]|nr:ABC transporter permease [Gemmatimonadales bacterium]